MPRLPSVPADKAIEVLSKLPVFENFHKGILVKEDLPVWDDACRNLQLMNLTTKKHNLYNRIYKDSAGIKKALIEYIKNQNKDTTTPTVLSENSTDTKFQEEQSEVSSNIDVVDLICCMQKEVLFAPFIQLVTDNPFRVIYGWPEQDQLWRKCFKQNSTVIMGVSNNFIKNHQDEESEILLYTIMGIIENCPVPLFHMLSENKHAEEVNFFICEWLRREIPVPTKFITHPYLPFLDAACTALNYCDFTTNNLECYQTIKNEVMEIQNCVIQIDLTYILEAINNLNYFKEIDLKSIKSFYLSSVIYLSEFKNLKNWEDALINIFAVLLSKYQDDKIIEIRQDLINEYLKSSVRDQLREFEYLNNTSKSYFCNKSFLKDNNSFSTEISEYVKSIEKKALSLCLNDKNDKTSEFNPYCNESFFETLVHCVQFFPTWTKIMNTDLLENYQGITEKYYTELHTNLQSKNNLYANEFLIEQAELLKTKCENCRDIIDEIPNIVHEKKNLVANFSYLSLEDDWKGKALKEKEFIDDDTNKNFSQIVSKNMAKSSKINLDERQDNDMLFSKINSSLLLEGDNCLLINMSQKSQELNKNNISKDYVTTLSTSHSKFKQKNEHDIQQRFLDSSINSFKEDFLSSTPISERYENTSSLVVFEVKNSESPTHLSRIDYEHNYLDKSKYSSNTKRKASPFPETLSVIEKKQPKKEAKYISQCPQIKVIHDNIISKTERSSKNLTKKLTKDLLIKNGNLLGGKNFNKRTYTFDDTSAFDSIFETFVQAMYNYNKFRVFCNDNAVKFKTHVEFLKAMVDYSNNKNIYTFYANRFHILLRVGEVSNSRIACNHNIGFYFSKLLEGNCSITEKIYCEICIKKSVIEHYTTKNVVNLKTSDLQGDFSKLLSMPTLKLCSQCHSKLNSVLEFHNYITIDLEHKNSEIKIEAIKEYQIINNIKYYLAGIVTYTQSKIKNETTQYVSYCRNNKGNWQKRKNIDKCVRYRIDTKKAIKPALVIYIKN